MRHKFYKTNITVEVLSDSALSESLTLAEIHDAITTGDCSGQITAWSHIGLTEKQVAKALLAQGSDPGFFGLAP